VAEKNYPLHLTCVCTLPCKVMRVKIVARMVQFHVIVSKVVD